MRDDEKLVTIAIFDMGFDAGLARGALEGIGIRALVPEEHRVQVGGPPYVFLAQLQVLEFDRDRAITELRRLQMRIIPPPSIAEE